MTKRPTNTMKKLMQMTFANTKKVQIWKVPTTYYIIWATFQVSENVLILTSTVKLVVKLVPNV